MTKVLLSLSDPLGAWAERQAANSNFDSVSDYVESLILRDQKDHESLAEFNRLVQEGEDSGISDRTVDEVLQEARQLAKDRRDGKL